MVLSVWFAGWRSVMELPFPLLRRAVGQCCPMLSPAKGAGAVCSQIRSPGMAGRRCQGVPLGCARHYVGWQSWPGQMLIGVQSFLNSLVLLWGQRLSAACPSSRLPGCSGDNADPSLPLPLCWATGRIFAVPKQQLHCNYSTGFAQPGTAGKGGGEMSSSLAGGRLLCLPLLVQHHGSGLRRSNP